MSTIRLFKTSNVAQPSVLAATWLLAEIDSAEGVGVSFTDSAITLDFHWDALAAAAETVFAQVLAETRFSGWVLDAESGAGLLAG